MRKLGIGLSGLAALAFVLASTSTPVFANEQNDAMESSYVLAQDDGAAAMEEDGAAMNEGATEDASGASGASEATPTPAPAKKAGKAGKRGGKHGKMGKKKKAGKKG